MDRATLEQQVAEAERHVLQGLEHIVIQRRVIFELARKQHDTTPALQLLKRFEEVHALLIADRDRLRKELASLADPRPSERPGERPGERAGERET